MSSQLPPSVQRTLRAVVRRRRGLAALLAGAWSCVGVGVLLAGAHLVPDLPFSSLEAVRPLAHLWLVMWLVGPSLLILLPVWRRTRSAFGVARAIDAVASGTRGSLGAAVDITTGPLLPEVSEAGSMGRLLDLHLSQAEAAAELIRPSELLPLASLGRIATLGPALVVLGAFVAGLHGPLTAQGLGLLFAPLPLEMIATQADDESTLPVTLVLKNLDLVLTPPAYSGREPLRLEGTTGDFSALPGTSVRLEADVEHGRADARLVWVSGDGVPSTGEVANGELQLDFVTGLRASYRVEIVVGEGREPLRTRAFRVQALRDDPPLLELTGPADGKEVHPDDPVTLGVRTSDDFALHKLTLVVERRGRVLSRRPLADVEGKSSWEGDVVWLPSAEIGRQGGRLSLVVEAFDNDTVLGPKVTRSAPLKLYVPTARDHHSRVLSLKRRLLDQGLDLLADLLVAVADANTRTRTQAATEEFDRQDDLARGFFKTAAELAAAMEKDDLERRDVYLGLGMLVQNLGRKWTPLRDDVARFVRTSKTLHLQRSVVSRLRTHREGAISELERIVLDLSAFVDLQIGDRVAEELADLAPDLADLSSLIRRAEQGDNLDSEIGSALSDLAEQMNKLAQALAERSSGPNDGFANQVPEELGEDLMTEIAQLLKEGKHAEALEKLREAMEAVSALQEQLAEESSEMAGSQVSAELQARIEEALAELNSLESRQSALIEETAELEERLGGAPGLSPEERVALAADIERLRDHLEQLPPEQADGMFRAQLRNWARVADRLAFNLGEKFAAGSLDEAASLSENVAEYLGEIARTAEESPGGTPGRASALRESSEGQRLAVSVAERLRKAEEEARAGQSQAAKKSDGLRGAQASVRQGLGALDKRLKELGGSAYNPARGRDQLATAGQLMERAEARMKAGELGAAHATETDALRQLQALRQSLEDSSRSMQQSGRMGGGGLARGRPGQEGAGDPWRRLDEWRGGANPEDSAVELTDPEDFVSPEAFRSLIQREAAGDAPKRYKPMNSSYYEELIR